MGRNPRIGTASDWVWFNVPHGPQKQVACFLRAYECCKAGKEEVRTSLALIQQAGALTATDERWKPRRAGQVSLAQYTCIMFGCHPFAHHPFVSLWHADTYFCLKG